jgi:hypothetical protein
MTEFKAMEEIDALLTGLKDDGERTRVLDWVLNKFGKKPSPVQAPAMIPPLQTAGKIGRATARAPKKPSKAKSGPGFVKDLNLHPTGKTALAEYAPAAQATSMDERSLVAVYYLKEVVGVEAVTVDHVFTCFKSMQWKLPSNLANSLQVVASRKGWLDTRAMQDIKVTSQGDNYVNHSLGKTKTPASKATAK